MQSGELNTVTTKPGTLMDIVLYNLRLRELTAIVKENRAFFDDFVAFLRAEGYESIAAFVSEENDERAGLTISRYLDRPAQATLYDGLLRPYSNGKAKWLFVAWLFRDAATQRLQPLLRSVPGNTEVERRTNLLNIVRKFAAPLFPDEENWQWPAISEVMLARLEGSRRALKGTLAEGLVRRSLEHIIRIHGISVKVGKAAAKIDSETYDIQVVGDRGTILFPVKTRETMGGGHALLFTRDIYRSIQVAIEHGHLCVPIVIAESWTGDLNSLHSELHILIQGNPNQVEALEPLLREKLEGVVQLLRSVA